MKARSSGSVSEQPDVGTHIARLVSIVDMGHQPGFEWQGKEIASAYKLRLTYELVNSEMEDGRPHWVSEDVTNSDNEKSTLAARVRTLKGSFDSLTAMIGAPCMVTLVEGKKGYVKIDGQGGVSGVPSGFPVGELRNDPVTFSLDNPDVSVFEALPEFIRNRIQENLDYEGSKLQKALSTDAPF